MSNRKIKFLKARGDTEYKWYDYSKYTGEVLRGIRSSGQKQECERRLKQWKSIKH